MVSWTRRYDPTVTNSWYARILPSTCGQPTRVAMHTAAWLNDGSLHAVHAPLPAGHTRCAMQCMLLQGVHVDRSWPTRHRSRRVHSQPRSAAQPPPFSSRHTQAAPIQASATKALTSPCAWLLSSDTSTVVAFHSLSSPRTRSRRGASGGTPCEHGTGVQRAARQASRAGRGAGRPGHTNKHSRCALQSLQLSSTQ